MAAACSGSGTGAGASVTVPPAVAVTATQARPHPAVTLSGRPECGSWQAQSSRTVSRSGPDRATLATSALSSLATVPEVASPHAGHGPPRLSASSVALPRQSLSCAEFAVISSTAYAMPAAGVAADELPAVVPVPSKGSPLSPALACYLCTADTI
jgi:hypothetical protein